MCNIYYNYLKDISKYSQLSNEEEVRLIYKAQNGDKKAFEKLILSNLKFVVKIAKGYMNQGLDLLDLISVGNIGLIKSIKRFNPQTGNKLITYSVWWIKQKILQAISNESRIIRLPLNRGAMAREITEKLSEQDYNNPGLLTVDKICDEFKLTEYELTILLSIYNISSEYYRNDIIANCELLITDSFFEKLVEAEIEIIWNNELKILSDREKFIAEKYFDIFGVSWTLQDIGEELGLTRERVRQIKEKITEKMESSMSLELFQRTDSLEFIRGNLMNSNFNIIEELSSYKINNFKVLSEEELSRDESEFDFEEELLNELYESL